MAKEERHKSGIGKTKTQIRCQQRDHRTGYGPEVSHLESPVAARQKHVSADELVDSAERQRQALGPGLIVHANEHVHLHSFLGEQ
jgi:hypothetical protein